MCCFRKKTLNKTAFVEGSEEGQEEAMQTSDTEMGDGNATIDELIAHAPDIPVYNDISYIRAKQCSPDRDNRGKLGIKESKAKANVASVCTSYYMVLKPSRRLLISALKLACSLIDATLIFVYIFGRNTK